MFVPDIAQHVGKFCEVATRNGKFFGELVRLSAAAFLVRSPWPVESRTRIIEASDITAISDLEAPRR